MPALQVMCRHGPQQVHVIVPLACKYGRIAVTGGRKIRRSDCFFVLPLLFSRPPVAVFPPSRCRRKRTAVHFSVDGGVDKNGGCLHALLR